MKGEKGFAIIETLISIALLGIIAVAFLSAMATASKAHFIADERASAKVLAQSQMEYLKSANYSPSYAPALISDEYAR